MQRVMSDSKLRQCGFRPKEGSYLTDREQFAAAGRITAKQQAALVRAYLVDYFRSAAPEYGCTDEKTLESFPNQRPLKNRVNIVLTKDEAYQVKDAVVVHDMEQLRVQLERNPVDVLQIIPFEIPCRHRITHIIVPRQNLLGLVQHGVHFVLSERNRPIYR